MEDNILNIHDICLDDNLEKEKDDGKFKGGASSMSE
jgi:hypothetical protein